jgi:hypothetical protein
MNVDFANLQICETNLLNLKNYMNILNVTWAHLENIKIFY